MAGGFGSERGEGAWAIFQATKRVWFCENEHPQEYNKGKIPPKL